MNPFEKLSKWIFLLVGPLDLADILLLKLPSIETDYYQALPVWLPHRIIHVNGLNNDFNFR